MTARVIGVVTTGRADLGPLTPVLRAIEKHRTLELALIASGAHLSGQFGGSIDSVRSAGFEAFAEISVGLSSDSRAGAARASAETVSGFADLFERWLPDVLVLLGDRFEMHAVAVAAVPFGIPMAHIHGGEVTLGAIDNAYRHSITKLSHLHFASTESAARRIRQMGEDPDSVLVTGAPSLDNLGQIEVADREELAAETGIGIDSEFLLVTFHPESIGIQQSKSQMEELLAALEASGFAALITASNPDPGGRAINDMAASAAEASERLTFVSNLGTRRYFGAMAAASAMVGNSSSGIIEAASFGLPVVNIGTRQDGRERGRNVIDASHDRVAIGEAIRTAVSADFEIGLMGLTNLYGDGHAGERIARALAAVELGPDLLRKPFFDMEQVSPPAV